MNPLNPLMALLLAAFLGAFPISALATDSFPPDRDGLKINPLPDFKLPKTVSVENAEKSHFAVLAEKLAQDPSAREAAGKRIAAFLMEPDTQGKRFVEERISAEVSGKMVSKWIEETLKKKAEDVSVLYFVVGPVSPALEELRKDERLALIKSGMEWTGILRGKLSDWTGKDKIVDELRIREFLNFAAAKSWDCLNSRTKAELGASDNSAGAPKVPGSEVSPPLAAAAAGDKYSLKEIYEDGAEVRILGGPSDAVPNTPRKISFKIYNKRINVGKDGKDQYKIIKEIGIFDITNPNNISGKRFALNGKDQTVRLYDDPGSREFELKFTEEKGERCFTFARPGALVGGCISPEDLCIKRAEQAKDSCDIVIGGVEFCKMPQGGNPSSYLMFRKTLIDNAKHEDALDLDPDLYVEVYRLGYDGRNEPVDVGAKGGPHLGTVNGKDYHFAWNPRARGGKGGWEIADGAGDLPKSEEKPKPGEKPKAGDAGSSSGPDSEGKTIAELKASDPELAKCQIIDAGGSLDPDLKGKYEIVLCGDAAATRPTFLVPKSKAHSTQRFTFDVPVLKASFLSHYLILELSKKVEYFDLNKVNDKGFVPAGVVDLENKKADKFYDDVLLVAALQNHLDVSDKNTIAGIAENIAKLPEGKPYVFSAEITKELEELVIKAVSNDKPYTIWPKLILPVDKNDPSVKSDGGGNNALDGVPDIQIRNSISLDNSRTATIIAGRSGVDIALYESVPSPGKVEPKQYFAVLLYDALAPKDPEKPDGEKEKKTFAYRKIPLENFPLLSKDLTIQGLVNRTEVKDRTTVQHRVIPGSTKNKGVLVMVQNGSFAGQQKNTAANCVGPIIWWGVDGDEALKICKADKF